MCLCLCYVYVELLSFSFWSYFNLLQILSVLSSSSSAVFSLLQFISAVAAATWARQIKYYMRNWKYSAIRVLARATAFDALMSNIFKLCENGGEWLYIYVQPVAVKTVVISPVDSLRSVSGKKISAKQFASLNPSSSSRWWTEIFRLIYEAAKRQKLSLVSDSNKEWE